MEDSAWLSACKERSTSFSDLIIERTGGQTMLYLTFSMISSVDFTLKIWVSEKYATIIRNKTTRDTIKVFYILAIQQGNCVFPKAEKVYSISSAEYLLLLPVMANGYMFRGSNSTIYILYSLLN